MTTLRSVPVDGVSDAESGGGCRTAGRSRPVASASCCTERRRACRRSATAGTRFDTSRLHGRARPAAAAELRGALHRPHPRVAAPVLVPHPRRRYRLLPQTESSTVQPPSSAASDLSDAQDPTRASAGARGLPWMRSHRRPHPAPCSHHAAPRDGRVGGCLQPAR